MLYTTLPPFLTRMIIKILHKYYRISQNYPEALKCWYYIKTGKRLNLSNPITINEKIQWLKVYDCNPLKTLLTDKYLVRQYIKDKIGEQYLVKLLGVWDNAENIDFHTLPSKFVLKVNHGSGWNIIIRNKNLMNIEQCKKKLNYWLQQNFAFKCGYELHYRHIKPLIIAEEYLENIENALYDYKFLCFHGDPKFCWIEKKDKINPQRTIYNQLFEKQPFQIRIKSELQNFEKPDNYEQMFDIATKLSAGFPFVRVDLYNIQGRILFGELTFTSTSGLLKIYPDEYNKILGDFINLPLLLDGAKKYDKRLFKV